MRGEGEISQLPDQPAPARDPWRRQAWRWLSFPLLLFLALPILALLLRSSPEEILSHLRERVVLQAIGLSLKTTLTATALTILFGTPVAYLLAQPGLRWNRALDTLVDMPTVLPPAVAGLGLLIAFGRRGLLGSLLSDVGVELAFTPVAVVLAQTFVASPFYIKAAAIGFRSIDRELLEAAQLDGAGRWGTFRTVLVPLAWNGLVSGSVLTWARALGEFGATIIFAGNFPGRTQTMPLAIYLGFELDFGAALTLSVILVGLSFVALLAVKLLLWREGTE